MIEVSNTQAQTVQPGQAIIFDRVVIKTNCCCFRNNSPRVKLTRNGIHKLTFNGDIGLATGTGEASISIALSGMPLTETRKTTVTPADGLVGNVTSITNVSICCGNYDTVSVINSSDAAITVAAGSVLIAERLCM